MVRGLIIFGSIWFVISIVPHWLLALGLALGFTGGAKRIARLVR